MNSPNSGPRTFRSGVSRVTASADLGTADLDGARSAVGHQLHLLPWFPRCIAWLPRTASGTARGGAVLPQPVAYARRTRLEPQSANTLSELGSLGRLPRRRSPDHADGELTEPVVLEGKRPASIASRIAAPAATNARSPGPASRVRYSLTRAAAALAMSVPIHSSPGSRRGEREDAYQGR